MKKIIRMMMQVILLASMLLLICSNTLLNTVLNENYVMDKFEESNYFSNLESICNSKFENYIYQSGLDKSVIENVVTLEKLKVDTGLILQNIYQGTKNQIETKTVEETIYQKIDNTVEGGYESLNDVTKENIEVFVGKLLDEYENAILHTSYEEEIYENISKIAKMLETVKTTSIYVIIIVLILIIVLNISKVYNAFSDAATILFVTAMFTIIIKYGNSYVIDVEKINQINVSISISARAVFYDIIEKLFNVGVICLIGGVLFTTVGVIIKSKMIEE